jgi:3-methyladenine DNA glycosylase/8-oxoguanine DNA glycosylase
VRGSRRRVLEPAAPVDLRLTLAPLVRPPTADFASDGAFWRATRTPEGPATERLQAEGGRIVVEAWGPGAERLLEDAPALVGLDDDPAAFRPRHRVLGELARRLAGLRLGRTGAVLEALVPAVLEQKVTSREARRSWRALVARYGEPAPGPGRLRLPPAPELLAALPSYALHPLGVERRRAETLRRACRAARRLEETAAMEPDRASARLRAIPGIGPWTAAEVTRTALGDPDAVSVGDYHLKHLVAWVLAGEPRGTDERMLELLEPYRGQRARAVRLIELSGLGPPRRAPGRPLRRIAAL